MRKAGCFIGLFVVFSLAMCGNDTVNRDFIGKFEFAGTGEDSVIRLKWDNHTLAIMDHAEADIATVLLVLRQAQQAMNFVEKESGEKLPEIMFIELIDSKDSLFKGGGKASGGGKIRLFLRDGYFKPTLLAHEFAHLIPEAKQKIGGFFSEGKANYFQSKYIDLFISDISNSMDSVSLNVWYWNETDDTKKKINSKYWDSEARFLLIPLAIKKNFYIPLNEVIKNFDLSYGHTLYSYEMTDAKWWNLSYYMYYSHAFCTYLIEKDGLQTFLTMMKKEQTLPLTENYVDSLLIEFYHKTTKELETEFTNYIMHYQYKNEYLKDPKIRQELEDYYMKWKNEAEALTNQTIK